MGTIGVVTAAVVGTAAAAAVTWVALRQPPTSGAKTTPQRPSSSNASAGAAPIVCAGADRVLRVAADGVCRASEKVVPLGVPGASSAGQDDNPWPPPPESDRPDPTRDLNARLDKIEKWTLLQVVNRAGRILFSVAPGGVSLFNADEAVVVAMRTNDQGGYLWTKSGDYQRTAYIGAMDTHIGLLIKERDLTRLQLGRRAAGNYSLMLPSAAGPVAAIGESKAGNGALILGDPAGHSKAALNAADNKGNVPIFSKKGEGIAFLTQGEQLGGLFAIGNALGDTFVKMGVKENRYGVVMAGPRAGFPYVPASGLPGSYFLGCAGGERCTGW